MYSNSRTGPIFRLITSFRYKPSRALFTSKHVHPTSDNTNHVDSMNWVTLCGESYARDSWYNLTPHIIELTKRLLHNQANHPLNLIKRRIVDFMYKRHVRREYGENKIGTPLFSVHDQLSPVVTTRQNFDSLLIPMTHPSRSRTDTYYLNETTLLRSHTSAHQFDLITSGLDAFLMVGDVYRRDEIDSLHYPVFHQLEGVRLFTSDELFRDAIDPSRCLRLFEKIPPSSPYYEATNQPFNTFPSFMLSSDKQPKHTNETAKRLEFELKTVLQDLARKLFGSAAHLRWVEAYFPFTHPSWELEVKTKFGYTNESNEEWTEILGCGIIRQEILERAGIPNKVGYAFGLGLERWAMQLYEIPDIRLFWSKDDGFLHQFQTNDVHANIKFKPVSIFPPCILDMSFWLDRNLTSNIEDSAQSFNSSTTTYNDENNLIKSVERDFCDLVRSIAGDVIEQIRLIDTYKDPKTNRQSLCYRLIYRDQYRTLTIDQIRPLHEKIAQTASDKLNLSIR